MLDLVEPAFFSSPIAAPSFNGRTADSGSAYRGSNPWGAANLFFSLQINNSLFLKITRDIFATRFLLFFAIGFAIRLLSVCYRVR